MKNKPTLIVVIATLLFSALSFFNYTPDPSVVSDSIAYADQAKSAISMKNWIDLGQALVGFGTMLYLWFTGKRNTTTLLLLVFAAFGLDSCKDTPALPATTAQSPVLSRDGVGQSTAVKFFKIDFSTTLTYSKLEEIYAENLKIIPLASAGDFLVATRNSGRSVGDVEDVLDGVGSLSYTVTQCSTSTVTLFGDTYNYPTDVTFDSDMLSFIETTGSLSTNQAKALFSIITITNLDDLSTNMGGPVQNECEGVFGFDCYGVDLDFGGGISGQWCLCYYDDNNDDEGGW